MKDYKQAGSHRVLEIRSKVGKERRVPLHLKLGGGTKPTTEFKAATLDLTEMLAK